MSPACAPWRARSASPAGEGAHAEVLALLAMTGASKALLLIGAGVAGLFTGLSLRSWREKRKK